jgi:hypothetical protein
MPHTCIIFVCIGIAFSPCIVVIVRFRHVILFEANNSEEGLEKGFSKSLWKVNDSF